MVIEFSVDQQTNPRMSDFLKRHEGWMRTDEESKYEKKKTNNKLKRSFYKIWKEA